MKGRTLIVRRIWVMMCVCGLLGSTPAMALPWQITDPGSGEDIERCQTIGYIVTGDDGIGYVIKVQSGTMVHQSNGGMIGDIGEDSGNLTVPDQNGWPVQTLALKLYRGTGEEHSINIDIYDNMGGNCL